MSFRRLNVRLRILEWLERDGLSQTQLAVWKEKRQALCIELNELYGLNQTDVVKYIAKQVNYSMITKMEKQLGIKLDLTPRLDSADDYQVVEEYSSMFF